MLITLLILFAALQVSDAVLTMLILRDGGRELNPIMRWLMDKSGIVLALVWVKLGLIVAVAVWVQSVWLLAVFIAIYIAVVVFNVRNYERMWSDAR
ncbi:DUF5658 family protein [Azonexus sp.]|uniref:DUF5658 family protein n=1 Tax=Azonexus sp. TaxID=1872668 RepID=UPI0039E6036F